MIGESDGDLAAAMDRALALAAAAAVAGDVPVGAVVIGPAVAVRAHVAAVSHPAAVGIPSAARTRAVVESRPVAAQARVSTVSHPAARTSTAANCQSAPACPDPAWRIVGEGFNRRDQAADPFAHAEIEAIQAAAATLGRWNLEDCTLVVSLEPCPMCAGAAVMSHVGRIVFGAWDEKMGACGSVWDIPRDPHIGFVPEVIGGLREQACAAVLREFFEARRTSR